jgi:FkbM family methyltransferase
MPATREDHIRYTREEWTKEPYFVKVIELLRSRGIKSYLDLGANVGEVCKILFDFIPTLEKAYLVEPQEDNYRFCYDRLKENKNINFYKFGIFYGNDSGVLHLDHSWKNPGSFSLYDTRENFQTTGEVIDLRKLEDMSIPFVDFVKIDVEGAEYNIIENSTYLKKCGIIEIELHDYSIDSLKFVKENFDNHEILWDPNYSNHVIVIKKKDD